MTTLLEHFIPEAQEYLASATAGLLKLERNPSDEALINEVFRAVHTLKGASGLFDVQGLTRLVHAGEDLLVEVRAGQLRLDSEIVDLLLDSLDRVSGWVEELARHGKLPDGAEGVSVDLSRRLRARMPYDGRKDEKPTVAAPPTVPDPPLDWLKDFPEEDRLAAFAATVAGGPSLLAVDYTPEEGCFYRGEDPFNLFRQLTGLMAFLPVYPVAPLPLTEADPYRSTLVLRALVAQPRGELEHLFRYVIEQVSITAIGPEALVIPMGDRGSEPANHDFIEDVTGRLAAKDWASVRDKVAAHLILTDARLLKASALRWLDVVAASPLPNLAWAAALAYCIANGLPIAAPLPAERPSADKRKPIAARLLAEQRRTLALPGSADEIKRRVAGIEATVGNVLASLALSLPEGELTTAAEEASGGKLASLEAILSTLQNKLEADVDPLSESEPVIATDPTTTEERRHIPNVLKVDQSKVDSLMNLIAEVVVFKNSLPFLAKRAEDVYGSRDLSREIKDQYAVIDRLAQELQRVIMDVSMLPVSEVFERFQRLVRDLARKLDKQINLQIVGGETAADKNIIQALGDPLIHLVRNSIDHGIELPDDRADAGKTEAATIQLKAYQEGDQIIIEVSDDGRGIDPAVIRLKAIEKGLITPEKADDLSDQDVINLVFAPGFSTAREISDLSGRGVGLDVVRTGIEKVNGRVSILSRKGEGTLVRLSLPLSMAVTRVMMVEAAGGLFGIPMDGINETVRVPRDRISKLKQSEAFVLRNTIVPLVRLNSLLKMPDLRDVADDEAIVVVRLGGRTVGLIIDRFREGIDVILKPLDGVLAGMQGFSGSALLGDGRILLVLNLKELL